VKSLKSIENKMKPLTVYAKYAWGVLIYNLIVIMWGAFVRATGSGAGCGQHWPTCQGEIIPIAPQLETLIEYSHRITSGLSLVSVVVLFIWAFRIYPKGNPTRTGAFLSFVFIIIESILGAGLVLLQLVAENVSMLRVFSMGIHLANTFMLVGVIALTAWWASGGTAIDFKSKKKEKNKLILALIIIVLVGVAGAVTALGDTLFPVHGADKAVTSVQVITKELLVKLRYLHPVLALGAALYLLNLFFHYRKANMSPALNIITKLGIFLYLLQILIGLTNIVLKVPTWLQLTHLLFADLVWISVVLLSAEILKKEPIPETS